MLWAEASQSTDVEDLLLSEVEPDHDLMSLHEAHRLFELLLLLLPPHQGDSPDPPPLGELESQVLQTEREASARFLL